MLANHFWGDGNVILIANTAISLVQGLFSFLLILQLPEYMQHMKLARGFSYLLAITYNVLYAWAGLEAWSGSKNAREKGQHYSFLWLMIDCFWMFNVIFYLPIFIINTGIIGSELIYEFTGGAYPIGILDNVHNFFHVLNFFNPLHWIYSMITYEGEEKSKLDDFEKGLSEEQIKYIEETGQLPEGFDQSMNFDA